VQVSTVPTSDGRLRATVTANPAAGTTLRELRLGEPRAMENAIVELPGGANISGRGGRHSLPAGTQTTTFHVRPVVAGQAATVPLVVVDSCGEWPTLVGGGTGALPAATPTLGPSPTPTHTWTATPTATASATATGTPTPTPTSGGKGVPSPTASATPSPTATVRAALKADVYAAIDITGSMLASDLENTRDALTLLAAELGLDPSNPAGPRLGVGQFVGERCTRTTPMAPIGSNLWNAPVRQMPGTGGGNPNVNDNWYWVGNWTAGPSAWCDPTNAPVLYNGGNFALPEFGTAPPFAPGATYPIPYYPGARTLQTLTQNAGAVNTAASTIADQRRPGSPTFITFRPSTFCGPRPFPRPGTFGCDANQDAIDPYWGADTMTATSHTAGLVTAAVELNSNRTRFAQGQPQYRRVLIFQTDGTVCTTEVPFTAAQSQARAQQVAAQLRNNPTPLLGIEIFTIMMYTNDGQETCPNNQVWDHNPPNTLFPWCGPGSSTLPAPEQRSAKDDHMIALSSSARDAGGNLANCSHYLPVSRTMPDGLTAAYRSIARHLAATIP
jgi:hypothetical protein